MTPQFNIDNIGYQLNVFFSWSMYKEGLSLSQLPLHLYLISPSHWGPFEPLNTSRSLNVGRKHKFTLNVVKYISVKLLW